MDSTNVLLKWEIVLEIGVLNKDNTAVIESSSELSISMSNQPGRSSPSLLHKQSSALVQTYGTHILSD